VKLQELQFDQEDRVLSRAPQIGAVNVAEEVSKGLKIYQGLDPPQIMVCRH
jgi:hypothetical protein